MSDTQRQALTTRLLDVRPFVLTYGLDNGVDSRMVGNCRIVEATSEEEIFRHCDEADIAVLVLGPRLAPSDAHAILARCASQARFARTANIVVGVGAEAALFQDCIDEDRLFYLSRARLTEATLLSLIAAAATRFRGAADRPGEFDVPAASTDAVQDFCIRISGETDIPGVGALLVEAARSLVNADHVEHLIYDAAKDLLWSQDESETTERSESAASGLVGYVVRTGERVELQLAGLDPRLDVEADQIQAGDDVHFLLVPIFGTSADVLGLVTLRRKAPSGAFSPADIEVIELLTRCAGSAICVILLKNRAQKPLLERHSVVRDVEIYRQEALENFRSFKEEGDLLNLSPRWLARAHWLAVLLFVVGFLYTTFVNVNEYVSGPALIRARSKIAAIATRPGMIRSVEVSAGDRVTTGDPLVRFSDAPGTTTVDRIAEQLLATSAGVVGAVHVRAGQYINQGEVVASIVDDAAGYEVIGFIPGNHVPQMHPGMPMVLRLQGYQGSYEEMRIDHIGAEIVEAQAALRYAGREGATALTVSGPVVVISSQLHSRIFFQHGRSYRYYDGMTGEIDVGVRSAPLLTSLLRGINEAFAR